MKILIVSAAKDAEIISRNVRAAGIEVMCVESAEAALRYVPKNMVSLVLCDMKLPAMDGPQFARAAKHLAGFRGVQLVAMSATESGWDRYRVEEDRRRATEAGFKAFVREPFDLGLPSILKALV